MRITQWRSYFSPKAAWPDQRCSCVTLEFARRRSLSVFVDLHARTS